MNQKEVIVYKPENYTAALEVLVESETVWLT